LGETLRLDLALLEQLAFGFQAFDGILVYKLKRLTIERAAKDVRQHARDFLEAGSRRRQDSPLILAQLSDLKRRG
jgi:hypothetical protein